MIVAILTILHIIMCISLILIVLLQTGKGSELAGAFGGGTSNTAFGVTGGISFIGKMTTAAAFCFLFTSFCLSLLPVGSGGSSAIEEEAAPAAPQAPIGDSSAEMEEKNANIPADSTSVDDDSNISEFEETESEY